MVRMANYVNNTNDTSSGLSKFFGIPLVPGLVQIQVGKSEAIAVKSRFYAFTPKTDKLSLNFGKSVGLIEGSRGRSGSKIR